MLLNLRRFLGEHRGTVAVAAALGIVPFVGFMALASDMGTILTVKHELQNAADAASLGGAWGLIPYVGTTNPTPNWSNAQNLAANLVGQNRAEGQTLTDAQIQVGYYNLATKTMQSSSITPTPQDAPAVRVNINKQTGENGGPVRLFFAQVLGKNFADVRATATAITGGPSKIPAGSGFPMAVSETLVQQWWNLDPAVSFRIGSDYHYPDDQAGQWTSFLVDANNVPIIRDLMDNGSPTELKIGDNIWIEPGTKDSLFSYAQSKVGKIVLLPVVNANFATHAWTPILGFVAFYIEAAEGVAANISRDTW